MLPEFREEPSNNPHVGFSSRVKVTSWRRSLSKTRERQPIAPRVFLGFVRSGQKTCT
jgi:hypothetical protein